MPLECSRTLCRLIVATLLAASAGGCAYNSATPSGPAAAGVLDGYAYALTDSGAQAPGQVGLTDADTHFYPYVQPLPEAGYWDPMTTGTYLIGDFGYDSSGLSNLSHGTASRSSGHSSNGSRPSTTSAGATTPTRAAPRPAAPRSSAPRASAQRPARSPSRPARTRSGVRKVNP